ncbi:hypothetical protein Syun_026459 [Stephania yunnanensis]|uniref:Uncharacterized protein n=1 Tax=Stephania yunnanensis TaxID=152371 RepID=A0AAP0F2G6_9MAGN
MIQCGSDGASLICYHCHQKQIRKINYGESGHHNKQKSLQMRFLVLYFYSSPKTY